MVFRYVLLTVTGAVVAFWAPIAGGYQPTWESLDTRPLPEWYDNAKLGILIHWGLFSVPSFGSERFWKDWKEGHPKFIRFMMENYPPSFKYQDFAPQFKAEFYDPEEWTDIFEASGARYVILTSKHFEGYSMWPSPHSWNWNSKDVGPNKDLVGVLQPHKWERGTSLDRHSWGYRREAQLKDYLSITELISQMAETISCGGNFLINIGPSADGRIPPIMEERLRQMGAWIEVNGDAVYASRPWTYQNDTVTPGVWYTRDKDIDLTYAIVLNWPTDCQLFLGAVKASKVTKIFLLGYGTPEGKLQRLKFETGAHGITVTFPDMSDVKSKWAWVLVLSGISPALHS
ncbi:alpha-L-fucosidase-like [Macrobrachium nipponense]|uniref:alpha-L-fucosidase-like n=1 Tax=Macrobrachium nipponense TaxID=159736 RepID=UPI0030C8C88C